VCKKGVSCIEVAESELEEERYSVQYREIIINLAEVEEGWAYLASSDQTPFAVDETPQQISNRRH
jgi:hypothetical protein